MFVAGANYSKLKTNLRLVVSRLKLLEKKKTELAQKARREIADFISNGKLERARIRVEHIIREDYLVEAMELVEMYCDLLLARFGLIQQMKTLDEGLSEAVSSVIWVTPRLQADVAELKVVSEQLTVKYGKPYAQAARENTLQSVNEKLMAKLSVQAPPRVLVEKYLIEIAKSHNVPYEPDESVLKEDEMLAGDMMALSNNSELIKFDDEEKNPNCFPGFPNVPNVPPGGGPPHNYGGGGGGGGGMSIGNPTISFPQPITTPFNYPPPNNAPEKPPRGVGNSSVPPPLPMMPPVSGPYPDGAAAAPPGSYSLPPAYDNVAHSQVPSYNSAVSPNNNNAPISASVYPDFGAGQNEVKVKPTDLDFLPELPSVPNTNLPSSDPPGSNSEDLDFDELTKRFEDLKKKK